MTRPQILLSVLGTATVISALSLNGQQQSLENGDTTWHKYVRAPMSRRVSPACILSKYTVGNVSNADSLTFPANAGLEPTILTRLAAGDDVPSFIIDFGLNTAGLLIIDFAESHNTTTGFPGLSLAFSETLQYLTDRSDFTRSDNAWGVSHLVLQRTTMQFFLLYFLCIGVTFAF